MYLSNIQPSFHLWWKENLVKHGKVSRYYETDCLGNFALLFKFLFLTRFFRNSHIWTRIFFVFLKNVLQQTWNSFNSKFEHQQKDRKRSYQVRQILGFLFNYLLYFSVKTVRKTVDLQKISKSSVWKSLGWVRIKNSFQRYYLTKLLRLTLVFTWNSAKQQKFKLIFLRALY